MITIRETGTLNCLRIADLAAERCLRDCPPVSSLGDRWLILRGLGDRYFFLSAIDPSHTAHNSPPRQFAICAGKEDLTHFVAPIIPALQDGQLFAESLDGLAAGNKRFQRRAYAASMLCGCVTEGAATGGDS